ncbi:SocA family protein [Martelella mediterranea]|uniref:Panacea domain-containing protein n=1 Tax=Martelella mediterranea TaxID=293089 RepID=UPI001E61048A|nr:Panacea domain-containing protein [Martelella mediterranea]MCD1633877.1 SocA family protein [Martelella mediterranea]
MRTKAPIIELKANRPKILESVVYLVCEADRLSKSASQYDIVKSVFLADRRHLNEYGRPITFDKYVAMEHGPVPSHVYDLLKKDPAAEDLPWSREQVGTKVWNYFSAKREADPDILSQSDFEALEEAFITVKSLGFSQIRKLTHEDPAYIDAWEDDGNQKAFDMSYMMLFDVPDIEKAMEVKFIAENA